MSRMKDKELAIRDRIAQMDAEIARLLGQRDGLVEALSLVGADVSGLTSRIARNEQAPRSRARGVKEAVLDIVTKAGSDGLTVNDVLDRAAADGVHLDRGSVSSLLSRLKREDTLAMLEGRYRLKKPDPAYGAPMH